jgi:hypothetical protein
VETETARALQLRVRALEAENSRLRGLAALADEPVPDASIRLVKYTVTLKARSEFSSATDLLDSTRALWCESVQPFVMRHEIRSSLHPLGCATLLVQFGADTRERLCEAVRAYLVEVDVMCFHYDVHRVLETMNFEDEYDGGVGADVIQDIMQRIRPKIVPV